MVYEPSDAHRRSNGVRARAQMAELSTAEAADTASAPAETPRNGTPLPQEAQGQADGRVYRTTAGGGDTRTPRGPMADKTRDVSARDASAPLSRCSAPTHGTCAPRRSRLGRTASPRVQQQLSAGP